MTVFSIFDYLLSNFIIFPIDEDVLFCIRYLSNISLLWNNQYDKIAQHLMAAQGKGIKIT